ncbi:threonine-phosphate decarboxylase CobD [Kaistia defluvii]|uniref:threonine-phosphate decarboxylase CobD n=1 Tax=Kaistia defluvii TaxID=410841 RepID=UPI00224FE409|nr:threonine-phosphate decarboxylase CobD [Kaistia defluvii]MCX5519565.1 threonine-phosphate decarboxylase CobD [Kaistia defluvii]
MLDHPLAPRHGGALRDASARYGVALENWLDLSTGINPYPYPLADLPASDFHRLPDPAALADLLAVARKAYDVPAKATIAAMPGSDLALRLLPLVAPAGDVAILSPTYSGHAEAWRRAGRSVHAAASLGEAAEQAAIVALVNPNNPDGRAVAPAELLRVAEQLAQRDGLLIVDEAFGEVAAALSMIPHLGAPPIVVLRSFGKFYGLAGLRLGFVLGQDVLVERLRDLVGDWPVSGPALSLGRQALGDSAWQSANRQRLAAARARLEALLAGAGLAVEGGTDLFVLIRTPQAVAMHESLARAGIWTRVFADQPDRIRIGLPPEDGFDRLERLLRSVGP